LALVFLGLVGVVAVLSPLGCSKQIDPWEGQGGPPNVLVSFAPLGSFVRGVTGDRGAVTSLSTVKGPHDYEEESKDPQLVRGATVFFTNGLSLDESFTDKLVRKFNPRHVKLGDELPRDLKREPRKDEDDDAKAGQKHEHGEFDPHAWLGIPQAIKMVERIRDELKSVDKPHAEEYDRNAASYIKRLQDLHTEGKQLVAKMKDKRLITFHESLGYFAPCYGLEIVDVIEEGPGDEPGSKKMQELVEKCAKEKITLIAVEPQYPQKSSAKTLQDELAKKNLKVKLVEIDPLETTTDTKVPGADWYLTKIRENLQTLANASK
jgi:ABC-type Zn uptake system ZnuABC Zn-binding protein ZnuA